MSSLKGNWAVHASSSSLTSGRLPRSWHPTLSPTETEPSPSSWRGCSASLACLRKDGRERVWERSWRSGHLQQQQQHHLQVWRNFKSQVAISSNGNKETGASVCGLHSECTWGQRLQIKASLNALIVWSPLQNKKSPWIVLLLGLRQISSRKGKIIYLENSFTKEHSSQLHLGTASWHTLKTVLAAISLTQLHIEMG